MKQNDFMELLGKSFHKMYGKDVPPPPRLRRPQNLDFVEIHAFSTDFLFFLKIFPATAQAYAFDGSATKACLDSEIDFSLSVS